MVVRECDPAEIKFLEGRIRKEILSATYDTEKNAYLIHPKKCIENIRVEMTVGILEDVIKDVRKDG